MWGAHRLAWIEAHGPIPDGLYVLHHCDNRPCCNPFGTRHLFLGTNLDNMADMVAKGRHSHRTTHWKSKLTEEDVTYIRANPAGVSQGALGRQFGVRQPHISNIIRGKAWAERKI